MIFRSWLGVIFLLFSYIFLQAQRPFFHVTVDDGLSNSAVLSICKDDLGFMWFGTRSGLNRYDGRTVKIFKNEAGNPHSLLSNDYIYDIEKDRSGNLWIGGQGGLSYYNVKKNSFDQVTAAKARLKNVASFSVLSICIAKNGNLWFGTNVGLVLLEGDTQTGKFTHFTMQNGLPSNEVYDIFEDSRGNVWAGTQQGLCRITAQKEKKYSMISWKPVGHHFIRTIAEDKKNNIWLGTDKQGLICISGGDGGIMPFNMTNAGLPSNNIRKIVPGNNGLLWVGTMKGLCLFDPAAGSAKAVYHNSVNQPSSINDNSIKAVFVDDRGSVWAGTNFGGINVMHENAVLFQVDRIHQTQVNLSGKIISALAGDLQGNMWIGTEGQGLNFYDKARQTTSVFQVNANGASIRSNTVKSIWVDKANNVWLGLLENGLDVYENKSGRFRHYPPGAATNSGQLNEGYISTIAAHKNGDLWLGTASQGIDILNPLTNTVTPVNETSGALSISNNYIKDIWVDTKGNTWMGTAKGINLLRAGTETPEIFTSANSKLQSNYINCIKEDRSGHIWIGTYSGGLSKYDRGTGSFTNYSVKDGLPGNNIAAIVFDAQDNIWVSTDKGLGWMYKGQKKFRSFDMRDGLPTNEFSLKAGLYDAATNTVYFGSYKGLVSFVPTQMPANPVPPPIAITAFKLFNKPVEVNSEAGILKQDIAYTQTITLKASQNIFTLDFVAFNYVSASKNQYAYKLDGFEKEWNYVSTPSATYTNLPAGNYEFLVKAANNDGVWNEKPVMLKIKVLPPLWRTWWAYSIYALLIVLALYYLNRFLRKQQKLASDLHYEQLTSERQEVLYQSKLDFFTRISHEIRTPLSLIYAPIEKLLGITQNDSQVQQQLLRVKEHTNRLLRLISELLDFRKIEDGSLNLKFAKAELVDYCRRIAASFETEAQAKQIEFTFSSDVPQVDIYIDGNQFEKVLFNLLSNSFKFTPAGESIALLIQDKETTVEVIVEDRGPGIPKEDQERIFNNFYQVSQEAAKPVGWGIGLALARQIVDLHKGVISVSSKEGGSQWTQFKIQLCKGIAHLDAALIVTGAQPDQAGLDDFQKTDTGHAMPATKELTVPGSGERATILIVEDNTDLREFLSQSLFEYDVMEAANGVEGLQKATELVPDLIITDVTMPEMDGFEFCDQLRQDIRVSHIPVIMLTAMDTPVHLVEGLQSGATVYMTKPFSLQVLELNVKNQLAAMQLLKNKYRNELASMPKEVLLDNPDQKFLSRLVELIEANIDEPDFNVGKLVTDMGMSQTVLYRKIKALTGAPITDFVKSVRFNRAAQLLKQKGMNISEVAYAVGFSDRKYFSKEFKKHFGKAPTDYIKDEEAPLS